VAFTNAEKQQRYRERHLGLDGTKRRVQHFLSVPTKAQLDRLAHYYGYTVTQVIEDLAAAAERKLLDRLGPAEARAYLDSKMQKGEAVTATGRRPSVRKKVMKRLRRRP
jgi:hypothetical protein